MDSYPVCLDIRAVLVVLKRKLSVAQDETLFIPDCPPCPNDSASGSCRLARIVKMKTANDAVDGIFSLADFFRLYS